MHTRQLGNVLASFVSVLSSRELGAGVSGARVFSGRPVPMVSYECGRLVCGGSKKKQEEAETGMKIGASRQPSLFAGETAAAAVAAVHRVCYSCVYSSVSSTC